jgi:sRNA-binding protein
VQARQELLAVLRVRWPQVFPEDLRQIKPWAIGLHQALMKELPEVKPHLIWQALRSFQRGGNGVYWRAVLQGGPRYGLEGAPNGEVSEKDQEHAKEQLAAIRAWRKAHRPARLQTAPAGQGGEAAPPAAEQQGNSI